MTRRRATHRPQTRLERLLVVRGIPPARINAKLRERMGDRAPDPKLVARWRYGDAEPRRKNMVRLLWAVREAAGDPAIRIEDIIDLDPDNPENWIDRSSRPGDFFVR